MVTKIIAGVAGAGLLAGGVTGTYFYLNSNYTIEQLLNKENPKKNNLRLGLSNKADWLQKWKDYITTNKTTGQLNEKDIWNIRNWKTVGAKEDAVPDEFAEKCKNKLSEKVVDSKDPKYLEFLKYCTK